LRWLAAVTVALYLLLIFWAMNDKMIGRWLGPGSVEPAKLSIEPIGRVQKVRYIGDAHIHTQIDTDTQTFLLPNAVRVVLYSDLEIRRQADKPAFVCVVGATQCERLYE
jgi:hypothetical protein